MIWIKNYFHTLWEITMEMAPWLLLGFFFAGLLKVLFPEKYINKTLGKPGFKSNLKAVALGVPLPLCSCGVIPAGVAIYRNGASKGATNSFLISTPQTGIDSIFATYALLGWPLAILRPVIAFLSGLIGGTVTDFTNNEQPPSNKHQKPITENQELKSINQKLKTILQYGFVTMVADIAKWLVIGLLLAALISVVIPPDFFQNTLGNVYLEFILILAISIPLYVCATGSIPIALVLLMKGISPGAAILFLMAGPATNVATIAVIAKSMGKKSLWAYLVSIIGSAILFSAFVNLLIPREWLLSTIPKINADGHTSIFPHWLNVLFAIILIGLILNSFFIQLSFNQNKRFKTNTMKTLSVNGMTCNHCKTNVEKNIAKIAGVEFVQADINKNEVVVDGNIDLNLIAKEIQELGYTVE